MPSLIMCERCQGSLARQGECAQSVTRPGLPVCCGARIHMPLRPALTSSYRSCVPAVARAVQALEQLTAARQPLALSALSRAIDVGPSSLLAILDRKSTRLNSSHTVIS